MAFDLIAAGGYGSGDLGDVSDPVGAINTTARAYIMQPIGDYALCFAFDEKQVGIYGDFEAGDEVLITVAGLSDYDTDCADGLGLWFIGSISYIDDDYYYHAAPTGEIGCCVNPHDQDALAKFVSFWRAGDYTNLRTTVTKIPHFRNLTLNEGCYLSPRAGFPLVFKCSGTLTLNGGHIDLRNRGIGDTIIRPTTQQEANGTLDTDKYSGWENAQTKDRFVMNVGDGATFIMAKKLVVADNSSRIGNPTAKGFQYCRYASDSQNSPNTTRTNIGGSTILLVAGSITDFDPAIIAKYRNTDETAGKGLARCYIASSTILRNDEGLYAYDCVSDNSRLAANYPNIKSFGDGSTGPSTLTSQLNNYAVITAIDSTQQVLTISDKTTTGAEPFAIGRLVMIHKNHRPPGPSVSVLYGQAGRFLLAKIIGINGNDITIDKKIPDALISTFANYQWQIITIPQFSSYTLSTTHAATPKFSGGKGGIFAIAVNGTCDLSGGKINVEDKGYKLLDYSTPGLAVIGNAQDAIKLPIGAGHGSVFILAKNLIMNSNTRIGATYSGANVGGLGGKKNSSHSTTISQRGGYQGATSTSSPVADNGIGGSPVYSHTDTRGGRGDNGYSAEAPVEGGLQGAHILIIADTITGFNQAAISTGGGGARYSVVTGSSTTASDAGYGTDGGAGYGGGGAGTHTHGDGGSGGYLGGGDGGICSACDGQSYGLGGGGAGWAFVYCNDAINQDTTDTVFF